MATRRTSGWHAAPAALLCLLCLATTAAAQPAATLEFEAETFESDGQANTLTLGQPRFSGDGLGMRADRAVVTGYGTAEAQYRLSGEVRFTGATGTMAADEAMSLRYDSEQQEWQLTGNVRITSGSAVLSADSAVFSLRGGVLTVADLRGSPASVQDTGADSGRTISGSANIMRFDEDTRTLRLLESARLQDDANEFTGCDLVYDFERERVTSGTSDCGEPVRIRIVPPTAADQTGDTDEAP